MTDKPKGTHDAIKAGVIDSWDYWLSSHDVTVPMLVMDGVEKAVTKWLDVHGADLFRTAVGEAIRNHPGLGPPAA